MPKSEKILFGSFVCLLAALLVSVLLACVSDLVVSGLALHECLKDNSVMECRQQLRGQDSRVRVD